MDPTADDGSTPLITKTRALLITESGKLLLIRRQPPEQDHTWWVLPGGGIEPVDSSLEDAACREVREETGGELRIHSLVQIAETSTWQAIFLGWVIGADKAMRSGPELTDGSGSYFFDEQPAARGHHHRRARQQHSPDHPQRLVPLQPAGPAQSIAGAGAILTRACVVKSGSRGKSTCCTTFYRSAAATEPSRTSTHVQPADVLNPVLTLLSGTAAEQKTKHSRLSRALG